MQLAIEKLNREEKIALSDLLTSEILTVLEGSKPGLLDSLTKQKAGIIRKIFPQLSVVCIGSKHNKKPDKDRPPLYAIAKNNTIGRNLARAQRSNNHEKIGLLLGYPKCCVEHWSKRPDKPWTSRVIYEIYQRSEKFSLFTNNIYNFSSRLGSNTSHFEMFDRYLKLNKDFPVFPPRLIFISHVPCSYDCAESVKIGRESHAVIKSYYPDLARQIKFVLSKPIIFFDIFSWIVFDGIAKNNQLRYRHILPPSSLINNALLVKFMAGNKVLVNEENIEIYQNNKLIDKYEKKNINDGILLGFGQKL